MHRTLFPVIALALLGPSSVLAAQGMGDPSPASAPATPSETRAESADLVVRGRIGPEEPVYLDLETLMAFPSETFSSVDPWDGKVHRFTGVSLKRLMDRLGIGKDARSILVRARNNYSTAIKREDYERYGYILAWAIDGQSFGADPSTRIRGPLAVAIDFGSNEDLDAEIYKHQLIWQATDILVQ